MQLENFEQASALYDDILSYRRLLKKIDNIYDIVNIISVLSNANSFVEVSIDNKDFSESLAADMKLKIETYVLNKIEIKQKQFDEL